jgi:hypothetical protein
MHDIVIVGIPLVAILAGILFNRNDTKELRSELHALCGEMISGFNKVDTRFESIHADLRQFYHLTGKLEGRIEAIEKRS